MYRFDSSRWQVMMPITADALTLASAFGWPLAVAWSLILLHKIRVEELH